VVGAAVVGGAVVTGAAVIGGAVVAGAAVIGSVWRSVVVEAAARSRTAASACFDSFGGLVSPPTTMRAMTATDTGAAMRAQREARAGGP